MKAAVLLFVAVSLAWGAWERSGETVIDTETNLQWADDLAAEERDTVSGRRCARPGCCC